MRHTRSETPGTVGRELVSLAWPILCSGVLGMLDASVNMMWVGRELGDVGVAALSNSNLLWVLLFAGAYGISMSGAVRVGRSLGGGDIEGAKAAIGAMVSLSTMLSIACVLPMLVWTHPLLRVLGTPVEAESQAIVYLRILLLSVPLSYLNGSIVTALQAAGDSKTGFYFSIACVSIDALLNPVFIIGLGPSPALGIGGSALATLVSQAFGLAGLLWKLYGTNHVLRLRREDLRFLRMDRKCAMAMLSQGGPMAAQSLWASAEEMLMISLVNRFGADTTAAYGAMVQLWSLIIMPAAALSAASTAVVARSIGAGRWDRVRATVWFGLSYGALATAVLVLLMEAFSGSAYGIFLPRGALSLQVAAQINHDATWSLVFLGAYTVWVGVLRATGVVWTPLGISAAVLAARFPITAALAGHARPRAIWWSFPASAVATAALAVLGCLGLRAQRSLIRQGIECRAAGSLGPATTPIHGSS